MSVMSVCTLVEGNKPISTWRSHSYECAAKRHRRLVRLSTIAAGAILVGLLVLWISPWVSARTAMDHYVPVFWTRFLIAASSALMMAIALLSKELAVAELKVRRLVAGRSHVLDHR